MKGMENRMEALEEGTKQVCDGCSASLKRRKIGVGLAGGGGALTVPVSAAPGDISIVGPGEA